ncbi:hypothetical protein D3248_08130 [Leucobacter zeae]|nr:hypothetical protein [Leucobacter zeae]
MHPRPTGTTATSDLGGPRPSRPVPVPPRIDRWPVAVRSAELQRGTLVRCGPGLRLVGWPESPRVRLHALAPWGADRRIAVMATAAWVWGALRSPDPELDFGTGGGRAAGARAPLTRIREFSCAPDEIIAFGEFRVTAPERTLVDMLRHTASFAPAHRVACRLLLLGVPGGRAALRERIACGRRQYRATALRRLDRL